MFPNVWSICPIGFHILVSFNSKQNLKIENLTNTISKASILSQGTLPFILVSCYPSSEPIIWRFFSCYLPLYLHLQNILIISLLLMN